MVRINAINHNLLINRLKQMKKSRVGSSIHPHVLTSVSLLAKIKGIFLMIYDKMSMNLHSEKGEMCRAGLMVASTALWALQVLSWLRSKKKKDESWSSFWDESWWPPGGLCGHLSCSINLWQLSSVIRNFFFTHLLKRFKLKRRVGVSREPLTERVTCGHLTSLFNCATQPVLRGDWPGLWLCVQSHSLGVLHMIDKANEDCSFLLRSHPLSWLTHSFVLMATCIKVVGTTTLAKVLCCR